MISARIAMYDGRRHGVISVSLMNGEEEDGAGQSEGGGRREEVSAGKYETEKGVEKPAAAAASGGQYDN